MKCSVVIAAAVLTGLCCANASAAALAGSFQMSGIVTVTANNTISWKTDAVGNAANLFSTSGETGSFVGEDGQNQVLNLLNPPDVVGSPGFADSVFIHFMVLPLPADLDVNFIFPGIYTAAQCATLPAAVGQQCTLPGSPFNFVNNPGGPSGVEATATWVFSGETSDHLSTWSANFTAQFNVPYQTILASFISGTAGASATNSYSAISTVVVTPVGSVPEPGTMALMGLGMVLFSAGLRRRFTKKV